MKNIRQYLIITILTGVLLVPGATWALDWSYEYDPYNDASGGATYEIYRMGYAIEDGKLYFNMLTGLPEEGGHGGEHNYMITDATLDTLSEKGVRADLIAELEPLKGILYPAKGDLQSALGSSWKANGIYSTAKEYGCHYEITDATLSKLAEKGFTAEQLDILETLKGQVWKHKTYFQNAVKTAVKSATGSNPSSSALNAIVSYAYNYELSSESFVRLRAKKIPEDILSAISVLQNVVYKNKAEFEQAVLDAIGPDLAAQYGSSKTSSYKNTIVNYAQDFSLTADSFAIFREKNMPESFLADLAAIQNQVFVYKGDLQNAIKSALDVYETYGVAKYAEKEATMINAGDLLININGSHTDGYVLDAEGNAQYASGEVFGLALTDHAGDMNYDMLHTDSAYKSAGKDDGYDWSAVSAGHLYSDAFFSTGVYEAYKAAAGDADGGLDPFGDKNNAPVHIAEFGDDLDYQGDVTWEKLDGYTVINPDGTAKKSVYEVNAVISLAALGVEEGDTFELWWAMECGNDFKAISGVVPETPTTGASSVPEPATLLLLGLGLLGVFGISKKRRA